jgi:hypothetical protein
MPGGGSSAFSCLNSSMDIGGHNLDRLKRLGNMTLRIGRPPAEGLCPKSMLPTFLPSDSGHQTSNIPK